MALSDQMVLGTRKYNIPADHFALFVETEDTTFYCTRRPQIDAPAKYIFEVGDEVECKMVRVYTPEQYQELRNARIGNGDPPEVPNESIWNDTSRPVFEAMVAKFEEIEKLVHLANWI